MPAFPASLRFLFRNRWIIPTLILGFLILVAVAAPMIAPQNTYDLAQIRLEESYIEPLWNDERSYVRDPNSDRPLFVLGSDGQGRDVLSAILFGLRVSLLVGFTGTLIALIAGVTLGLLSGYFGSRLDALVMRAADIQLSFPSVLIALFMMAVWGRPDEQGVMKIIIAVGIVHWVLYARVVRGVVLAEREKDYISAIRALGARVPRILLLHLLPNVFNPILVISAIQFASVVMLEATLSFLGLGVPITRPSLGMLIKFGFREFFSGHWWIWFFPGMMLVILIVAINWLADILRDRFALKG